MLQEQSAITVSEFVLGISVDTLFEQEVAKEKKRNNSRGNKFLRNPKPVICY